MQVAGALAHAHARGVIHRDIKPSNLLLDTNGIVWVTDFGLAKSDDEELTQTGDFLGTLRYMSPERFSGKCDALSDVYALGLTIYELLLQRPAFESSDQLKLIDLITKTDPPTPRSLDRRIPRDLETIVLKAIEKDPESRYASAKELGADLDRFMHDVPIRARRASIPERLFRWSRRNKALSAALAGVLLLLTSLTVTSTVAYFRQTALTMEKQAETTRALAAEGTAKEQEEEAKRKAAEATAARETIRQNLYTAQMVSAGYAAMQPEGIGQVLRLTEAWIPKAGEDDLRGWEWYYLQSLSYSAQLTLRGSNLFLRSAHWSPDGTRLACARETDSGEVVVVWDAVSGRVLLETPVMIDGRQAGLPSRISWSPDGKRLACGTWGGKVFVLDAATGDTLLISRREHTKVILVVDWSPDGSQLASGDRGGTVKLWDATTGKVLHTLAGHTGPVRWFSWHPRDNRLASAGWDATVRVWDRATGKQLHTLEGHLGDVWWVVWSPDGKRLASVGDKGNIEIWSAETYAELLEIEGHASRIGSVDWSPDGKQLATGGQDHSVRVWSAATGDQIALLQGHRAEVWSVQFSPDGKRLASVGDDDTVKVWELSMGDGNRDYSTGQEHVPVVRWSPDGTRLAVGGDGVKWWSRAGDPDPVVLMKPGQTYATTVTWHPQGTRLAAGCADGKIRVWDTDTAKLLHTITAHPKSSLWILVHWSPDGTQLASIRNGSETLQIWDAATGAERLAITQEGASAFDWSSDGAKLVVGGRTGPVAIWDTATGRKLRVVKQQSSVVDTLAWSPDNKKLASTRFDHTVELWDLSTGEVKILKGHTDDARRVCWSPDSTRVASAGNDRTVRVWNAATGEEMLVLMGKDRSILWVDWSPDGKRIAACGQGGKVTVWDATTGYQREAARLDTAATRPAGKDGK